MAARGRHAFVLRLVVFAVTVLAFAGVQVRAQRYKEVVVYSAEHDGPTEWQLGCSRAKSRLARDAFREFVIPHVLREGANITSTCPLGPMRDVYHEQEAHKERYRRSYWRSLYSNKIFKSEYYVDRHMENRHMDKIPSSADTCLADYCDVLMCDEYAYRRATEDQVRKGLFKHKPCSESRMAAARDKCFALHVACFEAPQGNTRGRAEALFAEHVCGSLHCSSFHKIIPALVRMKPNRYRALYFACLIIGMLFLIAYYTIVGLTWIERRQRPDLRTYKSHSRAKTRAPTSTAQRIAPWLFTNKRKGS